MAPRCIILYCSMYIGLYHCMHYMLLYHFVFISYVVVCHRTYKLADVVAVCIQFVCIYVFISFFVLERKQRKEQHPTWCERSTVREKHS